MKAGLLTLRNIRRIYAVFFILLFVLLLWVTGFRRLKGYETPLFLELDPLVALASFLTSWTIYKGLALSLLLSSALSSSAVSSVPGYARWGLSIRLPEVFSIN